MSSSFRWGDSDSSDEEEIRVSSAHTQENDEEGQDGGSVQAVDPGKRHSSLRTHPTTASFSSHSQDHRSQRFHRASNKNNNKPKGVRGKVSRAKSVGGMPTGPSTNWKDLARSSSRFGSSGNSDKIDGSAWMAQRRERMRAREEQQKIVTEKRQKEMEEHKRSRRKSQLEALKVAMQGLDIENKSSTGGATVRSDNGSRSNSKQHESKVEEGAPLTEGGPSPLQVMSTIATPTKRESAENAQFDVGMRIDRGGRGRGEDRGRLQARGLGTGREGSDRPERSPLDRDRYAISQGNEKRHHEGSHVNFQKNSNLGKPRKAEVMKGKKQIVRTSSGNAEYFVSNKFEESTTKGQLQADGTVRLTKSRPKRYKRK